MTLRPVSADETAPSSNKLNNSDETATFPASALLGQLGDIRGSVRTAMLERKEVDQDDPELPSKVEAKLKELVAVATDYTEFLKANTNPKDRDAFEKTQNELSARVMSYFNSNFNTAVASLGVKTHLDTVKVVVSPGSLLFDLYTATARPPTAPLALAIHQNKVQKMAADMESPEFEVTPEIVQVVRKPLEDDRLWREVNVTGRINVNGETKYLQLSTVAIGFYPKTMNALLSLFGAGNGEAT